MEPLDFWIGHRRGSWSSLTPLTRSPESQELRPEQRPFPGRDVSVTRRHAGNGRASTVAPPEAVDLLLIKWTKDRGTEPQRPKDQFPWFWDGDTMRGERVNDVHLVVAK